MAQSCHIPRKKKLKSPYVRGFKNKSAFSLTSSQIWLSKSSCGRSPVHLPHKILQEESHCFCVYPYHILHLRDEWEGQTLEVNTYLANCLSSNHPTKRQVSLPLYLDILIHGRSGKRESLIKIQK